MLLLGAVPRVLDNLRDDIVDLHAELKAKLVELGIRIVLANCVEKL
jgi:hypothetical protein